MKRMKRILELLLPKDEKVLSLSPRPSQERDKEKTKFKEYQVKEFKKTIRSLLTDLDQYVDEKDKASLVVSHPPGAIICEDLERESLSGIKQPADSTTNSEVPSTFQDMMMAVKAYSGTQNFMQQRYRMH